MPNMSLRRLCRSAAIVTASVALIATTVVPAALADDAQPDLQLPFACDAQVHLSTYPNHFPSGKGLDLWRGDGGGPFTSYGMLVLAPADMRITATVEDHGVQESWTPLRITAQLLADPDWTITFEHFAGGSLAKFGTAKGAEGQIIRRGTPIGQVGWTGKVEPKLESRSHLHLELRNGGVPADIRFDGRLLPAHSPGAIASGDFVYVSRNSCVGESSDVGTPGGGWTDWNAIPGAATQLAVARGGDGRLEAMHVGPDGRMWHTWQEQPGESWRFGDWQGVPGSATDIALAAGGGGRLEAFHLAADGRIFHRWQWEVAGGWSDWVEQPGRAVDIAAASYSSGRLETFAITPSGDVVNRWQAEPNGSWSEGWSALPGLSDPVSLTAVANADDRMVVVAADAAGRLWQLTQQQPGSAWGSWQRLEGSAATAALARNDDGRLELFTAEPGGAMHARWQSSPGGPFGSPNVIPGSAGALAAATDGLGHIELFHVGSDDRMFHKWQLWPNADAPRGGTGGPGSGPAFIDVPPEHTHYDGIVAAADAQLLRGYSDLGFRPDRHVQRGQIASILAAALQLDTTVSLGGELSDIRGTTHEGAIAAVVRAGLMSGYEDGTFGPSDPTSRGQVASVLAAAMQLDLDDPSGPSFPDTAGSVHDDAIRAVARARVVNGLADGTFGPAVPTTRAQFATMSARVYTDCGC